MPRNHHSKKIRPNVMGYLMTKMMMMMGRFYVIIVWQQSLWFQSFVLALTLCREWLPHSSSSIASVHRSLLIYWLTFGCIHMFITSKLSLFFFFNYYYYYFFNTSSLMWLWKSLLNLEQIIIKFQSNNNFKSHVKVKW
jgi:hypothetical protein